MYRNLITLSVIQYGGYKFFSVLDDQNGTNVLYTVRYYSVPRSRAYSVGYPMEDINSSPYHAIRMARMLLYAPRSHRPDAEYKKAHASGTQKNQNCHCKRYITCADQVKYKRTR